MAGRKDESSLRPYQRPSSSAGHGSLVKEARKSGRKNGVAGREAILGNTSFQEKKRLCGDRSGIDLTLNLSWGKRKKDDFLEEGRRVLSVHPQLLETKKMLKGKRKKGGLPRGVKSNLGTISPRWRGLSKMGSKRNAAEQKITVPGQQKDLASWAPLRSTFFAREEKAIRWTKVQ